VTDAEDRSVPEPWHAPGGACPSCGAPSHPGYTCSGKTTSEVIRLLWPDRRLHPAERGQT
jgi:hypothetical protein